MREQPLRHRLSVLQGLIKIPCSRVPYFTFIFRHYRKIKEFGKKTHILYSIVFPPGFRLNPNLPSFFTKTLQLQARDLLKVAYVTLDQGWSVLGKADYNLVVVLKQLCERILAANIKPSSPRDRNIIDKLRSVETVFLVLHYDSEFQKSIIEAIQRVLLRDPRYKDEYEQAPELVRKILTQEASLPSLYNLLLGLNMLKYRRLLSLQNILCTTLGNIVNTEEFACQSGVQAKIDGYVEETTTKMSELGEQKNELRRIQKFLPMTDSGEVDFALLKHLYESGTQTSKGFDFANDQENVMVFAPRLIRIFDRTFYPLLYSKVVLSKLGRMSVFSQSFFQAEFPKIRQLIGRLEKHGFTFRNLTRNRYLQLKDQSFSAVTTEFEVIRLIEEGLDSLLAMGKKLAKILTTRRDGSGERSSPLEPVVLQGKSFSLPFRGRTIRSNNLLNGKSVEEALSFASSICFLTPVFFQDQNALDLLGRESEINREIQSHLHALRRIADPESLRSIEEMVI
jgi:hypothetical protein